MIDLVVIVADADAEAAVRTLLERRHQSLHIRRITNSVIRYPGRDSGVYRQAQDILKPYLKIASYALVMLDREGSGQERHQTAVQMEADLETHLQRNGWIADTGASRCAAVVFDPELEVWVWSRSPHVPSVLGLSQEHLERVLADFECTPTGKPLRPKEALEAALYRARRPFSPSVFRELAERVSLQVNERAFNKFRSVLQQWFPAVS